MRKNTKIKQLKAIIVNMNSVEQTEKAPIVVYYTMAAQEKMENMHLSTRQQTVLK